MAIHLRLKRYPPGLDLKERPRQFVNGISIKPRLHERFFACDGDAIFLKLSHRQHAAKIASVATL